MARRKAKTVREMTNTEFVAHLMDYSESGALAQIFVIDALTKMAVKVAEADPEKINGGLINGHAWVRVAQEIKRKLEDKYVRR